ncbi:MAG: acyltransferase, partial [Bacteroidales bacterium]|nr:acyltransferase [Bacteroidales bacterium]
PPQPTFTPKDTNIVKGIATILLLTHHLFYEHPEIGPSIDGFPIVYNFALLSKVCVAIFVILSGYGLTESLRNKRNNWRLFYVNRYVKLMFNYWFIFIIFVPIGVFLFDRTLDSVYGNDITVPFLLNILGLQYFVNIWGYNATWWFMSLIIILYLIYPMLYILISNFKIYSLLFFFCFCFINISVGKYNNISIIAIYLFPFSLGIFLSQINGFVLITHVTQELIKNIFIVKMRYRVIKAIIYFMILYLIAFQRQYGKLINNVRIDGLFGFVIILFSFQYLSKIKYINSFLEILGVHSFNIFLFHTFFYYYFSYNIFYSMNSIVAIILFTTICLGISVLIDIIKKIINFSSLQEKTIVMLNELSCEIKN